MATQIFDNDFLHTHPIYQNVHSTLVDVSNRDYAMAPFDKRIECLDMDDYEAHYMQNGANDSTMDALGHSNTSRRRWIVMSPDIFGKAYIAKEDIPYVPLHDYKAVLANFCRLIDSHLWDEVEKEFETWGSKTYSRISYISQERELLEDMLRNVWIKIESEKDKVDADTWDYISLIKEDYPHILG